MRYSSDSHHGHAPRALARPQARQLGVRLISPRTHSSPQRQCDGDLKHAKHIATAGRTRGGSSRPAVLSAQSACIVKRKGSTMLALSTASGCYVLIFRLSFLQPKLSKTMAQAQNRNASTNKAVPRGDYGALKLVAFLVNTPVPRGRVGKPALSLPGATCGQHGGRTGRRTAVARGGMTADALG